MSLDHLADTVFLYRTSKGMSQKELAKWFGIKPPVGAQFISNWERRKAPVPLKYIKTMAQKDPAWREIFKQAIVDDLKETLKKEIG